MLWGPTVSHLSSISSSKPVVPGLVRAALVGLPRARGGDWRLARLLVAGLVVLPLASRPLGIWAGNLPDWAQPVRGGLVWWDATMERAGLTEPYDFIHQWVRNYVARPF